MAHSYVAQYGSFTDTRYSRKVNGVMVPVGTIDAWEVTIVGLNLPRPCPPGTPSSPCPAVTTLSVVIDDKAGKYLEAIGY